MSEPSQKSFIAVLAKSQLSAFVGGIVDYGVMLLCTELLGIHYVISIGIGGTIGAAVNYSINRYWTFDSRDQSKATQIPKFIVVVIGSIILKAGGTYLLTEIFSIDYRISRLITDACVAFGFNFTLQKFWVFRQT